MENLQHITSLDSMGATAYFARELEYVKTQMYNIIYPEYKAFTLIPVSTEAGPGATSIVYHQFDTTGYMKIIASYADDLPRADVIGKEFVSIVRSLGGSYGWNIQEVRSSALAGRPISDQKARAGRRAYDQTVNQLAWFGDAKYNMLGLLNQPNIPAGPVAVGAVTGNTTWLGASPKNNDEKLKDMNDIMAEVTTSTLGTEIPDTLLLPTREYGHVKSEPRSSTSDTTILQYFLNNHEGVTVDWVNELADVANPPSGAGGPLNVMFAYRRSPDKLTLELPQLYEQFPVQERGLELIVPTHARIGGVIVYYPLSGLFKEGF